MSRPIKPVYTKPWPLWNVSCHSNYYICQLGHAYISAISVMFVFHWYLGFISFYSTYKPDKNQYYFIFSFVEPKCCLIDTLQSTWRRTGCWFFSGCFWWPSKYQMERWRQRRSPLQHQRPLKVKIHFWFLCSLFTKYF